MSLIPNEKTKPVLTRSGDYAPAQEWNNDDPLPSSMFQIQYFEDGASEVTLISAEPDENNLHQTLAYAGFDKNGTLDAVGFDNHQGGRIDFNDTTDGTLHYSDLSSKELITLRDQKTMSATASKLLAVMNQTSPSNYQVRGAENYKGEKHLHPENLIHTMETALIETALSPKMLITVNADHMTLPQSKQATAFKQQNKLKA